MPINETRLATLARELVSNGVSGAEPDAKPAYSAQVKISEIKGVHTDLDAVHVKWLKNSIKELGQLHHVIVTEDLQLLAGSHRVEACKQLGWETIWAKIIPLTGLHAELARIDENLVSRRLTVLERAEHLHRWKEIYEILHPETRSTASGGAFRGNQHSKELTADHAVTRKPSFVESAARKIGIPKRTIYEAIKIVDDIAHEIRDLLRKTPVADRKEDLKLLANKPPEKQMMVAMLISMDKDKDKDITVPQALTKLRQAEIASIKSRKVKPKDGVFHVIVIDPPWPMARLPYPTMTIDEIANIKIPAADNCQLFLWATQTFLPVAIKILETWGFEYKYMMVWNKSRGFQRAGFPEFNCEFILYGTKGSPKFVDTKNFKTCFKAPRGKHSEKPEYFYELLRRVTAGRRLDMFNRRPIEGFETWGNEAADNEASDNEVADNEDQVA